jgi:hypothetical protein
MAPNEKHERKEMAERTLFYNKVQAWVLLAVLALAITGLVFQTQSRGLSHRAFTIATSANEAAANANDPVSVPGPPGGKVLTMAQVPSIRGKSHVSAVWLGYTDEQNCSPAERVGERQWQDCGLGR